MFFNAKYSKLHIGHFAAETFIDIFKYDRYMRVMNYIRSYRFDAKTMMGSLPIQHYVNKAIDDHLKGTKLLTKSTNNAKPMHVNFL